MKNTELKALEVKVSEIMGKDVQIVRNVTPLKQKMTVDEMLLEMENKQRIMAAQDRERAAKRKKPSLSLSQLVSKAIEKVDHAVKQVDDYFFFDEEKWEIEYREAKGYPMPAPIQAPEVTQPQSSKIVYIDFSKQ